MSWIYVILLAAMSFAVAVFVLKLPRTAWTMLGAALLFGLAGYALQGSPGLAGAPKPAAIEQDESGELLVSARRSFFDTGQLPSRWVVTGDAFARRGNFAQAAGLYGNAVEEGPGDAEAWLALGIALVEHAEGNLTPAAIYAFERAAALNPENGPRNGGARYFLGLAWLRAGEPLRARELWVEALENAPRNAQWRGDLALRIERLDLLLKMTMGQEKHTK